jgi:hypothetical protein
MKWKALASLWTFALGVALSYHPPKMARVPLREPCTEIERQWRCLANAMQEATEIAERFGGNYSLTGGLRNGRAIVRIQQAGQPGGEIEFSCVSVPECDQ